MRKLAFLTTLTFVSGAVILTSCGRSSIDKKPWEKGEVEVAPGYFLEVEERWASSDDGKPDVGWTELHLRKTPSGKSWEVVELRMKWEGTNVHWKGNSRPLNLRAFEGKLYLITFDRSRGYDDCFFRYFGQQGSELREIPASEFPRAVAGQNLKFYHRYSMGVTGRLDEVQIAREQDTSDIYFRTTLTADIWNHLATGQQYSETHKRSTVSKSLLDDFIRTNKPIKLTTIVRDQPASKGEGNARATNQSLKVP